MMPWFSFHLLWARNGHMKQLLQTSWHSGSFFPHFYTATICSAVCTFKALTKHGIVLRWHENKNNVSAHLQRAYWCSPLTIVWSKLETNDLCMGTNINWNKYTWNEKDDLALIHGCKKPHAFIYGRSVLAETSHKPLTGIAKRGLANTPVYI